jgi:hypothetical protein
MPNLPQAIADFYESENSTDVAILTACFATDARVHDESHEYLGHAEIAAWRIETQAKTPFSSRPIDVREDDATFRVSTEVSGSFPNSPIMLEHRFTLVEGHIADLDIG